MNTGTHAHTILSVEQLAVRFGGVIALSDVSFVIRQGEIASLIGPNGAGKTTAFDVITGFLSASEGSIRYRGQLLNRLRPHEIAGLGVVRTFQKTSVFGGNTGLENLLMALHLQSNSKLWEILLSVPRVRAEDRHLRQQAEEILEFVGLANHAHKLGSTLAYGAQRLLEVAVALAAKPSLLLLDEPVSGMNPAETASFMAMLSKIREQGITILLVEHDMKMVMGVSDRVMVLSQGTVIAEGTPEEIQRNPEVISTYLGHEVGHA